VQVGGEAAARLYFALGVHDQRLPWTLTIIFLKPGTIPGARQPLRPLHRGKMIPVERHRQIRSDEQITPEQLRPFDNACERRRQRVNRLQSLIGAATGVRERNNPVLPENAMGSAAKLGEPIRADAMKLINAQTEFAAEAGICQLAEHRIQVGLVREPNPVGGDLIEVEAQFGRPAAQDVQELRIKKWLTSSEAKNAYSVGMSVLQKAHGRRNR